MTILEAQDQNNNQEADLVVEERSRALIATISEEQTEAEIEQILNMNGITDDEALNIIFDASSVYEDLLATLVVDIRARTGNHHLFMASIKCATHTLQLAIKDAIKLLGQTDSNAISLCRVVAKFLRLQSTKTELFRAGIKSIVPKLDVETRWSSTYLMVKKFGIFVNSYHSDKQCIYLIRNDLFDTVCSHHLN